jgi:hypothetical protein
MAITRSQIPKQVEGKLRGARDEKKKKKESSKLSKRNPLARILGSILFKQKVVQSKKLYNRKRFKHYD